MRRFLAARPPIALLITALAVVLVACGGGSGASSAPSVTPTASATPDLATIFREKMNAWEGGAKADISGTMEISSITFNVTGTYTAALGNNLMRMDLEVPGVATAKQGTATVNGVAYEMNQEGYWLLKDTSSGASPSGAAFADSPLGKAFESTSGVTVTGTTNVNGRTLHLIEATGTQSLDAATFGMSDPSITDFTAGLTFLAEANGDLAGFDVKASWMQDLNAEHVAAAMDLRWLITDTGPSVTVAAPSPVWTTHSSSALGYTVLYPVGWDVSFIPASGEAQALDRFTSRDGWQLDVYHYSDINAGVTAETWFTESETLLKQGSGVAPEVLVDIPGTSLNVRIFALHASDEYGPFYLQEAAVFGGSDAWDLDGYSTPGNETADQVLFLSLVRSFTTLP